MATPERSRLAELAAELRQQHAACESALRNAIEHAFRAGALLIEAKTLVPHGEWGMWLAEHFAGSERTAQRYMQIVREVGDPTRVADLPVREVLTSLAAPRTADESEAPAEEAPEVVDAEPVLEPGPSIFDMLHDSGDVDDMAKELAEKDAHLARTRFPRAGVEYKTVCQVRAAAASAQRSLEYATRGRDKSDWTCAEALAGAGREFREAGELASELSSMLHKRVRDPNR